MPPIAATEKLQGFMLTGAEKDISDGRILVQRLFASSRQRVRQFEDVFATQFPVTRLKAVVNKSWQWL